MDITIEVMLPTRGSADFTEAGNANYDTLGIVDVYPWLVGARMDTDGTVVRDTPVGMPRTGFVYVTGVPDTAVARIQQVLTSPWFDETGGLVAKRIWKGDQSLIPSAVKNRLATNRFISITWTQFKNFLRNVKEQRAFSDADVA